MGFSLQYWVRYLGVALCFALLGVDHNHKAYAQCEKQSKAVFHVAAGIVLSRSDKQRLKKIEQALNRYTMFEAHILQTDSNGKQVTGRVWIKRPGQMRLVYDPPSPWLLVANEGKVIFRDSQLDQTTLIPMDRTPLGLLLRRCVRLTDGVTITGFQQGRGLIQVSLVRTALPTEGSLTLIFSENPSDPNSMTLRAWRVVDAQGRETQVLLEDVHAVNTIAANLFTLPSLEDPTESTSKNVSTGASHDSSAGLLTKSP